jgi:hypothetical protein
MSRTIIVQLTKRQANALIDAAASYEMELDDIAEHADPGTELQGILGRKRALANATGVLARALHP